MGYKTAIGIRYENELPTIQKGEDTLLPIYEAFTNAWEAIHEKFQGDLTQGKICINLYVNSMSDDKDEKVLYCFDKILVADNGIGLDEKNYKRLVDLRDDSKNMSNKGTGRVQFLHFFDETILDSTYEEESKETGNREKKRRKVTLSKKFLVENAILREDVNEPDPKASDSKTTVIFKTPLSDKHDKGKEGKGGEEDPYYGISAKDLKEKLIHHFLWKFCCNREKLPEICIGRYVDSELKGSEQIYSANIPDYNKRNLIEVNYSKLDNRNKIIDTGEKEKFELRSFVLPKEMLGSNAIYLVSKGETACPLPLNSLSEGDDIGGKRYMFLLSGGYIDKHDSDNRGNIKLISAKEFKERNKDSLLDEKVVLSDDIERETNNEILELHGEIKEKVSEKNSKIDKLKDMFLLNDKTVESIRSDIKTSDKTIDILKQFYKSDAEIRAKQDAKIERQMEELEKLSPNDEDYQKKLQAKANEFVRTVPLQNRTVLSQYVARRKLVLEIFDKILKKEMDNLRNGGRINESILHNLIFRKNSENSSPESSDLWLLNEEYIYFSGTSDRKFDSITIGEESLFKQDSELTKDEYDYKYRSENNVGNRKPDILLFPNEGKCIIIELKAPDVEVSRHIDQINAYARLIHNLSKEKYRFNTYYGYLIGENIDINTIQDFNTDFKPAATLGYFFRPHYTVSGERFGRGTGSLYTEIIKYSDLLKRAKSRNDLFIRKLEHGDDPSPDTNTR